MDKIRGWVREAGSDAASFGIEGRLYATSGTPDGWRRTVGDWRRVGASHLSVDTAGAGLRGADAHIDRLRRVREILDA